MKKKFRSLTLKLMIAMFLAIILSFVILLSLYLTDDIRDKNLLKEISETNKTMVKAVVLDDIKNEENIVKDYSIWNDLYDFVQSKDTNWAKVNIDPIINNFQKDIVMVYDIKGNVLYSSPSIKKFHFPNLFHKLHGSHGNFFMLNDTNVVHITWSVITKSSDVERKLPAGGYLLIAKEWNNKKILDFEGKTGLSLYFHRYPNFDTIPDVEKKLFIIHHRLYGYDDEMVAIMHFQIKMIKVLHNNTREFIFLGAVISALIILFFFWLYVMRNVTRPISTIIKSLRTGDISLLSPIKSGRIDDEWDTLVKLVEDNYRKTQELEQANSTKNKFFDLIAHDLKTPFNGIIGFSSILLEESESYSEDEKKKFISLIHKSSKNAEKLLTRLLDWARLQTGRINLSPSKFDAKKMIDSVISFHTANAEHRKVSLITDIKESFDVYADESMLESALRNIVSNAIKFTQSGGIVIVSSKKFVDYLQITVSDNGKGMSEELKSSLFKVGEKVVDIDMTGNKGTGLGIILSKEFIERNGGKIWVESELGKGSKFHFTIPLST